MWKSLDLVFVELSPPYDLGVPKALRFRSPSKICGSRFLILAFSPPIGFNPEGLSGLANAQGVYELAFQWSF